MTNSRASSRLLVTFATYNERETLPKLVDAVFEQLPQANVLVVDDNSPDGTGDWCDQHAATQPRLHCLHRRGKLGLGTATIAAFEYAIEQQYDYVLNMDADFSHDPGYAPQIVEAMENAAGEPLADVAIGSRYVPGGKIEGWPLLRHCMSRAVNGYSRLLLRLPTRDCSGAFRCYRVSLLREIDFDRVVSRGYSFQEEILWRLRRAGARFSEIPITFVNRQEGASKINVHEALSAAWILFRLRLESLFRR
ncbi:MAG: polyprenol monophosphomannose synthase [Planctomycetales bacterium]|nr:polyprenol monophosphomannose synthase [Planctomycetales bacterium]